MTTFPCSDAKTTSTALAKALKGDTIVCTGDIGAISGPKQIAAGLTFDLSGATIHDWRLARLRDARIISPRLVPSGPKAAALSIEDSDGVTVEDITGLGLLAMGGELAGGIGINLVNSRGITISEGRFDGLRTPVKTASVVGLILADLDFLRTGEDCIGLGATGEVRGRNLRAWEPATLPGVHADMIQCKDVTPTNAACWDVAFKRVTGRGPMQIFQSKDVTGLWLEGFLADTTMPGAVNIQRAIRAVLRNIEIATLASIGGTQAHIDDRGADVRYEGRVVARAYGGAAERVYA